MKLSHEYALGWVLLGLFLLFWVGQTVVGWQEFVVEQAEHGEIAQVFGAEGYVWNWGRATLENWQSEMLQLFTMVALTSVLIYKGSAESKDSDDEMKQTLARLERRLEALASDAPTADGASEQVLQPLPSRQRRDRRDGPGAAAGPADRGAARRPDLGHQQ